MKWLPIFARAAAPETAPADPVREAAIVLSSHRAAGHRNAVMSNVTAIRAYVNKTRPGVLGEKARVLG